MKSKSIFAFAGVMTAFALAAAEITYDMSGSGGWGDGSRWVGGTVPVSDDTVVIPAGSAEVNDADLAVYKVVRVKMTSADSKLVIKAENLGEPLCGYRWITGVGTIVKESSRVWILSKSAATYTGDWDIKAGGVQFGDNSNTTYIGPYSATKMVAGKIYVRNGAYLDIAGYATKPEQSLGYKEVRIAGFHSNESSTDSKGALHNCGWGQPRTNAFSCIVLEDDAYISAVGGGCSLGVVGHNPELPGYIDLNGHDLHLTVNKARSLLFRLKNVLVTNSVPETGGNIFLEASYDTGKHVLRIDEDVVIDKNVKIHTGKNGQILFNNAECRTPVTGTITDSGTGSDIGVESAMAPADTNRTEWAGTVEIPSGQTFTAELDDSSKRILLTGKITGTGDISLHEGSKGQVVLGGDVSEFTGNVIVNGREGFGSFMALKPDSLPSAEKVTVDGSTLTVPLANWTLERYFALANGVNYSNHVDGTNAYVSSVTMSLEGSGSDTLDLEVPDGKITDYDNVAIGIAGEGTLNVTELPAEGRVNFASYGGTVNFAMDTPFKLGRLLAASFDGADKGAKVKFDGVTADIGTNELFVGGLNGLGPSGVKGEMSIKDSLVYAVDAGDTPHETGIGVGMNGEGRLVVENSCVTGRLQMAGTADSCASVILKGGEFVSLGDRGSSQDKGQTLIAKKGHGYLEIDGCDVGSEGPVFVGRYGAAGVIVQKGGSLRAGLVEGSPFSLFYVGTHRGSDNPLRAVGQYWLKGGYGWSSHRLKIAAGGNSGNYDRKTTGIVTIDGENSKFETVGQFVRMAINPASIGILNLNNGGTLYAGGIVGYCSEGGPRGVSCVNFNGGKHEFYGWSAPYVYGLEGGTSEKTGPISHITVFKGGGTLVLTTSDRKTFMGRPIDAPTGNGIGSVAWSDTTKEFPVCPVVLIEGDGFGASAMAVYDSSTRTVSGITVTSPGCDYTEATAVVRVGTETNLYTLACDLVPNDRTGGMTFKHLDNGRVHFDQANTYKGQTTLVGVYGDSEFTISNENAFATSSAIALKSGLLNITRFTLDDLTAPFKFMGGRVTGDSETYQIPEGKMVIDCKDILAGEEYTVVNNTNLVLPDSITVLNSDLLDDRQDYELLTLPSGYAGKEPFFSGIEGARYVKRYGSKYRLCYRWGTVISFR